MSSKKGNEKKRAQLGMPQGTAGNRLRKNILFYLLQETDRDQCYQCEKRIETVEELSIEHKVPWLDSQDPVGLFFDLTNIAFSHLSCNSSKGRYAGPVRARIALECAYCGKIFERPLKQVTNKRRHRAQKLFYCDQDCANDARRSK